MNGEDTPINLQDIKNAVVASNLTAAGDIHVGDKMIFHLAPKEIVFSSHDAVLPTSYVPRRFTKPAQGDLWNRTLYQSIPQELEVYSHIILLGDAGFGKSTELRRIHYDLAQQNRYQVVFYELKNLYNEKTGFPLLKIGASDSEEIEKRVVLFDGLDEVNFTEATQCINLLKQEYPKLKLVVTCRNVVYDRSLEGFEPYYLQRLDDDELDQFLLQQLPSSREQFLYEIPSHEIKELLRIPFYLAKAISFYSQNGNSLPQRKIELLQHFINESLRIRLDKRNNLAIIEPILKKHHKELEKVAFVMECLGNNRLTKEQLQKLVEKPEENSDLVFNKSSLIQYQEGHFQFAHRIIQEYLAAKVLSKARSFKEIKRIIAVEPDLKKIKTTWGNSIADLWSLLDGESSIKDRLLRWLLKHNPEIIIKFEREKFSPDDRVKVLEIIYKEYQNTERSFDYNLFYPSELASFCQSYQSFKFLYQELKNAKNHLDRNNVLELLRNFENLYFPKELVVELREELFRNIYDFDSDGGYVRYLSIDVLTHFYTDLSEVEIAQLVNTFFDSRDAYQRLSVYKVIWKTRYQQTVMDLLLKRLVQLEDKDWRGEDNLMDEDYQMELCFTKLDSEKQIVTYFECYPKVFEERWSSQVKDHFRSLLLKASTKNISQEGHHRIFKSINMILVDHICHGHRGLKNICIDYIEKSQMGEEAVRFCLENPQYPYQKVVAILFKIEMIPLCLDVYKKGNLDHQWVEYLIGWLGRVDYILMQDFVTQLNEVSKSKFEKPEPHTYNPGIEKTQEKEKLRVEKELHFSRNLFLDMVDKVFDFFGKEKLKKGEVFFKGGSYDENTEFYLRFPHSLLWIIDGAESLSRNEIKDKLIENWDWISISNLKKFLERNQEVVLSINEITEVQNWCDKHFQKMKLPERVTNGDIVFAYFTLKYSFTHFEDQLYLNMIGVGLQRHLSSDFDLVKFALDIKGISFDLIKEKILKVLGEQKIKDYEFLNHIVYAKEYKIVESLPALQGIIENKEEDNAYRRKALEGFIECGGDMDYIWDLVKKVDWTDIIEEHLLELCMAKDREQAEVMLQKKFKLAPNDEQKLAYARLLVRMSNLIGLQYLIGYTKDNKKSPFPDDWGWHRNPIEFNNISGIKQLLELYDLGFDSEMHQNDFDSIRRKLRTMIYNLALENDGAHYAKVQNSIRCYRYRNRHVLRLPKAIQAFFKPAQVKTLDFLKYLSDDLAYRYHSTRRLSIDDAISLYEEVT